MKDTAWKGFPFFALPEELRLEIYEHVFDLKQEVLFSTMAWNELPDYLDRAEPLLALDNTGVFHQEATISYLRTRKIIFEGIGGRVKGAGPKITAMLKPFGVKCYDEIRWVEIWAWDDNILEYAVSELQRCTNLKKVKVVLTDDTDLSTKRVKQLFRHLRGPLQLCIHYEDEYVENEAPARRMTINMPTLPELARLTSG